MKLHLVRFALVLAALSALTAMPATAETLDFEALAEGEIVSQVLGDAGSGPVLVRGRNPGFPGSNTAMIFDSDCVGGCSGSDSDLGSPNSTFGGPGLGSGGSSGRPFQNDRALGNVLIISEDLDSNDPDDEGVLNGISFELDFSALGSVTLVDVDVMDVEANTEAGGTIRLFDASNALIVEIPLPATGNNGLAKVDLGPTSGVTRMRVLMNGSGAIDNVAFRTCGNGVRDPGEQCDGDDASACPGACRETCVCGFCGDGTMDPDEQCDDGNRDDADACSNDCTIHCPPGTPDCPTPSLALTKDCAPQVDGINAITIGIENTGTTSLENCQVSDPVEPSCEQAVPVLQPGDSFEIACEATDLVQDTVNTVTVECEVGGAEGETLMESTSTLCEVPPCELQVMKQCVVLEPPDDTDPGKAMKSSKGTKSKKLKHSPGKAAKSQKGQKAKVAKSTKGKSVDPDPPSEPADECVIVAGEPGKHKKAMKLLKGHKAKSVKGTPGKASKQQKGTKAKTTKSRKGKRVDPYESVTPEPGYVLASNDSGGGTHSKTLKSVKSTKGVTKAKSVKGTPGKAAKKLKGRKSAKGKVAKNKKGKGVNGGEPGAPNIKYIYTVKNVGTVPVGDISAVDDLLGEVSGSPIAGPLAPGESVMLMDASFIDETTTNEVIVTGYASGQTCTATDTALVTVQPPPEAPFTCDKPIDEITMIWTGPQSIRVKAWKGNVGSTLLADIDGIDTGEEVSVSGYAGSPNDVIWEIFAAGTSSKLGESTFHLSCSDEDMDEAEDCGKPQGDGKDKSGFIDLWQLEGMRDASGVFDCTEDPCGLGFELVLLLPPLMAVRRRMRR